VARKTIHYNGHTFDVSYEICNPKEHVDIIMLHGWGSNKALMKQAFGDLLQGFRHIYIDLPGFGNSTAPVALKSEDYARIVELLLIEINGRKDIALGHSFGGKVATLLEPELLVLLSSAGIVLPKPMKIKAKIALYKTLKLFGLTKFRNYFVAEDAKRLSRQMYETFKNVVDEDFSEIFASFSNKALVCWGEQDSATPLAAGEKIASLIEDARFVVYPGDHYFFMQHTASIAKLIEACFIENLECR